MENLTHTAEHVLEDFHSADLSQSEKKKISREISTALAAMTCLVAGLIYKLLFPQQAAVAGLIYSVEGLYAAGCGQRHGDPGDHCGAGLLHHRTA